MTAITAKEFAQDVWHMLETSVEQEMPEATAEEKEHAKVAILNSLAGQFFTMEMK